MPPAAKDIPGDGVEIVTAVLVTVIVAVLAGETTRGVFARVALAAVDVARHNAALSTSENINFLIYIHCLGFWGTGCLDKRSLHKVYISTKLYNRITNQAIKNDIIY